MNAEANGLVCRVHCALSVPVRIVKLMRSEVRERIRRPVARSPLQGRRELIVRNCFSQSWMMADVVTLKASRTTHLAAGKFILLSRRCPTAILGILCRVPH